MIRVFRDHCFERAQKRGAGGRFSKPIRNRGMQYGTLWYGTINDGRLKQPLLSIDALL